MTRPSWLGRAARNRHRHAIEQASRQWHSARTRRKILISTQVIVDITGGKLKEDKAGKNSNPDVNVTLRAFDPPLRYPLNESDLKDK